MSDVVDGISQLLNSVPKHNPLPFLRFLQQVKDFSSKGSSENEDIRKKRPSGCLDSSSSNVVLDEAYALFDRANILLDGGLHRCQDWIGVKNLYFEAGALLSSVGEHGEAALAFNHAAGVCKFYGTELEVANAAEFAVDNYRLSDPILAVLMLQDLAQLYVRNDRVISAAKAYKQSGDIDAAMGNDSQALKSYQKALSLYNKNNPLQQSIYVQILENVARLTINLRQYPEAHDTFAQLISFPSQRLSRPKTIAFTLLSRFVDTNNDTWFDTLYFLNKEHDTYESKFSDFLKSTENKLIKDIFKASNELSLMVLDKGILQYQLSAQYSKDSHLENLLDSIRLILQNRISSFI